MTLAQRFREGHAQPVKRCVIGRLMDSLPSEERDALAAMLNDRESWPALYIQDALRAEGHSASDTSVITHRKERCVCYIGAQS